jgi:hypothetical protein
MRHFTIFLILLIIASTGYAQEFNNIPITEKELNSDIERSFSMGITRGFSGIKPYSKKELLNVYGETQSGYIYRYIERDLMVEDSSSSNFYIEPISYITLRAYSFDTDVPGKKSYCLENMEGNCLDKALNAFLNVTGQGRLHRNITFFYEGQLKGSEEETDAILKKAYIKVKTGPFHWEFGKDSLWIGHGYHGSLLLSSNAEPFLLAKLDTDPFRLPFFLSKIGEFKYTLFHGWLDDFNMLGHRLAWKPFDIFEFGANQTVVYAKGRGYDITDWPHLFFSSEENVPGAYFNNDQRASLDIALYMPFLNKLPLLQGGKIYVEYAGEDTYAVWQKEDKNWVGPFGFEFLGGAILTGLYLTTGSTDFRIEYAENYRSYPIFYDWYEKHGIHKASKGEQWYKGTPFLNKGVLMGHHMGPEAEDIFFEIKHRFDNLSLTGFYDKERHHLYKKIDQYHIYKTTPEIRHQYGLDILYAFERFEINGTVIYNRYKNVDSDPDTLKISVTEGKEAKEVIGGIGIRYLW